MWIFPMGDILSKIFIVSAFVLAFITTITIHLKYDKWEVTSITFLGCLVVLSLCLGILTPKQAIDKLQKGELIEIEK